MNNVLPYRLLLTVVMATVYLFVSAGQTVAVTFVSINGAGTGLFELRHIDSTTGASTLISDFTFDTNFWFANTLNVDDATDEILAVSSSTTLHRIDATTGSVVAQHPLAVTNLQSLGLRSDGQLIGINGAGGGMNTVRTIDPSDGSTVALNTFAFDTGFWFNSTYDVDQANNRLYGLSSSETLYEWDATTGAVLNTTLLDVGSLAQTFAVTGARADGKLVGITTGGGSNQIRLIDPADPTGTTTQLLDFTFDSGGFFADTFVVDAANDRFYVASSSPTLYEFSLSTGQIVSTKPMDVSPHAMALIHLSPSCIVGDANCDGYVDVSGDILPAFSNFTGPGSFGKTRADGDVEGTPQGATANLDPHDTDVDVSDILTMFGAFTGPPTDSGATDEGGLAATEAADPSIPDLIYDPATGEVVLDVDGSGIIGYVLKNGAGTFLAGNHTPILAGVTTSLAGELSEAALSSPAGANSIGFVFPTGMDLAALSSYLTTNEVSRSLGAPIVPFDLVVLGPAVPEPATYGLAACGLVGLGLCHALKKGTVRRRRMA